MKLPAVLAPLRHGRYARYWIGMRAALYTGAAGFGICVALLLGGVRPTGLGPAV